MDKGTSTVYKKAVPSYDFLEMSPAVNVINRATLGLIGHNRYATTGAKTVDNAHPFVHGDVTLVHNGTLRAAGGLKDFVKFDTDSEAIAYNLSITDDPVPVLESLLGAYVLIWTTPDNKLHIAKNDERPLHWFKVTTTQGAQPMIVFASEKDMGTWIINRRNLTLADDGAVTSGKYITLDLNTHKQTIKEFTPKKPVQATYYGGSASGGSYPSRYNSNYNTSYRFPRDMEVTFVVDFVKGSTAHGTTLDGRYDVTVVSTVATSLKAGKVYTAEVQYIQADRTITPRSGTITPVADTVVSTDAVCGVCDQSITEDDWNSDAVEIYGDCYTHDTCLLAFTKEM
jgi:hypothetical protein